MQSEKHLDRAIALASDGKYYEANLALKAIEDSGRWMDPGIAKLKRYFYLR